jgi:hypothetical protein
MLIILLNKKRTIGKGRQIKVIKCHLWVCQGFYFIKLPSVQFSVIFNASPKQIYEEYVQNVTLHLFSSADKKDERCMYKLVVCNGKLLQPSH